MRVVRRPGQAAVSTRRLVAGVVLVCAAVLAIVRACGNDPSATGPLAANVNQKGMANCTPAPLPRSAITTWHSPVWFALDSFVNESRSPLTIESISLIDPHNVRLRGALVYEIVHQRYQLIQSGGLADLASSVPASAWARRQYVPGAVIAAGHPVSDFAAPSLNLYQIVPAVQQKHPGGGWALGEVVTYRVGGQTYKVTAYSGYIISNGNNCQSLTNAVFAAFRATG
jgi:hypothetical protein